MRITETIERECCQPQDMKPYRGLGSAWTRSFCQHCGQPWGTAERKSVGKEPEIMSIKLLPQEVR